MTSRKHPVARCEQCGRSFRMTELSADFFQALSHPCPRDLTDAIRAHLISCAAVAVVADAQLVIAESRALLETNAAVRKEAQQSRDLARSLRAESEAERQTRKARVVPAADVTAEEQKWKSSP